jgi:hypothetical protein
MGLYVKMSFNRRQHRIYAVDTTTNQRVLIEGVFSGNKYANQCRFECKEDEGPIPGGDWLIGRAYIPAEHAGEKGDYTWYRLYKISGNCALYRNIPVIDPVTGKPVYRGEFNLHVGLESNGCVTVPSKTGKKV